MITCQADVLDEHKTFMDEGLFFYWLNKQSILNSLPEGRSRVLLVDNCSAHKIAEDVMNGVHKSRIALECFPLLFSPYATDPVQSADLFVSQRIKSEWRARRNVEIMEMIPNNTWSGSIGSGRTVNPGKRFFLRLTSEMVRCVGQLRDANGVLFTRKAMIRKQMA